MAPRKLGALALEPGSLRASRDDLTDAAAHAAMCPKIDGIQKVQPGSPVKIVQGDAQQASKGAAETSPQAGAKGAQ